jgi:hypothetical protein
VIVTINYRLGEYHTFTDELPLILSLGDFGFLVVNGTDAKGNYGIGDQVTALQWLKQNIAQFGGDPDNVRPEYDLTKARN